MQGQGEARGAGCPLQERKFPRWLAVQPRDGGGGKGAVALPAGGPLSGESWPGSAVSHLHGHSSSPIFPSHPEPGPWSPCQSPPHCPSPEERTMVVRRGWWRGLAGRTRLAGAIVCGALNVCTASALAAEWGTSIPGMLPEPTEGPVLEHLASPAHPCQASESSCHSHLWGRRWRGMR